MSTKSEAFLLAFMIVILYLLTYDLKPPKYKIIEDVVNVKVIGVINSFFSTHNTYLNGIYLSLTEDEEKILYKISIKKNLFKKNKRSFTYLVKPGDSIFKKKDNDTISIYRNKDLILKAIIENGNFSLN